MLEVDQKMQGKKTRIRPEADQKWSKRRLEAWLGLVHCASQNVTIKLPLWLTFNIYGLQKMFPKNVETNKDEFKFKKSQKYILIDRMN